MDNKKPFPFKRGDIIENGWTTEINPTHLSVYFRCGKLSGFDTYECISYDMKIVQHLKYENRLVVVGHMDEFDKFVKALKKLDKSKAYKGE